MTNTRLILGLAVAALAVAWGCNKASPPAPSAGAAPQTKALEAQVAKLEEDLRAARSEAAAAAERQSREQARGQAAERERDDARAGLKARTAERDALVAKLDGIQKLLRDALGQAEAAVGAPAPPAIPVVAPPPAALNTSETLPPPRGL
jgi:outer membrane murein-binding lipoprotein Lpp